MSNPIYKQINTDIVYCDQAFSFEQLLAIRRLGDSLYAKGEVDTTTGDRTSRKAWVTSFIPNEECLLVYPQICALAKNINIQYFGFDVDSYFEKFWYTTYSAPTDRLDWHSDKTNAYALGGANIKMGIVLQLSEPTEYDGGIVEVMTDDGIEIIEKKMGLMYSLPAYTPHRVTPITSGERRVLVAWFAGPKFK